MSEILLKFGSALRLDSFQMTQMTSTWRLVKSYRSIDVEKIVRHEPKWLVFFFEGFHPSKQGQPSTQPKQGSWKGSRYVYIYICILKSHMHIRHFAIRYSPNIHLTKVAEEFLAGSFLSIHLGEAQSWINVVWIKLFPRWWQLKYVLYVHPENWGRWTQFWRSYFWRGVENNHQRMDLGIQYDGQSWGFRNPIGNRPSSLGFEWSQKKGGNKISCWIPLQCTPPHRFFCCLEPTGYQEEGGETWEGLEEGSKGSKGSKGPKHVLTRWVLMDGWIGWMIDWRMNWFKGELSLNQEDPQGMKIAASSEMMFTKSLNLVQYYNACEIVHHIFFEREGDVSSRIFFLYPNWVKDLVVEESWWHCIFRCQCRYRSMRWWWFDVMTRDFRIAKLMMMMMMMMLMMMMMMMIPLTNIAYKLYIKLDSPARRTLPRSVQWHAGWAGVHGWPVDVGPPKGNPSSSEN